MLAGIAVSRWTSIRFNGELSLSDGLLFIYTVVLTFLVSKWWRESQFRSDSLRQHMSNLADEIREALPALQESIVKLTKEPTASEIYAQIVPQFRQLNNCLYETELLSKECCKTVSLRQAQKALLEFKKVVTSVTPTHPMTPQLQSECDVKLTLLRRALVELKLSIYRC